MLLQATSKRLFLLLFVAGCLPITTNAFNISNHIKDTKFFQDTALVKGKVSGTEEGSVLPQVSVQNLVSGRGTFTNTSGEFTISARRGDSTPLFLRWQSAPNHHLPRRKVFGYTYVRRR